MPRIPFKIAESYVEEKGINPSAAGAVGGAMARGGQDISELGLYAANVFNAIQQAQDRVETLKLEHLVDADLRKRAQSYQMRTDYTNFDKSIDADLTEIREKYAGIIGDNARVMEAFNTAFIVKSSQFVHAIQAKKIKEITNEGIFQAEQEADIAAQKYANARSPDERTAINNDFTGKVQTLIESNVLPRDYAFKLTKAFEKKSQEATVVNASHSNSVEDITAVVSRLDKGEFNRLDEKERATYRGALQSRIEHLQTAGRTAADEMAVTNAYTSLKNMWGDDYETMLKVSRNVAFQKENDLDSKRAHTLETRLNTEQSQVNNEKKRLHDDEESKLQTAISDGTATVDTIRKTQHLTADEREKWENALNKRLKRSDDDISNTEDATAYIAINNMIDRGVDSKTVKSYIIEYPLKTATRFRLVDRVDNERDKETETGKRAAHQLLESQIAPSKDWFYNPPGPEQEARLADAQMVLDDWVKTRKKEGKPPTQHEIYEHAKEMLKNPIHYRTFTEVMNQRFKDEKQREMEAESRKKRLELPAVTPENYEMGKTYRDEKGNHFTYEGKKDGKDQWKLVK